MTWHTRSSFYALLACVAAGCAEHRDEAAFSGLEFRTRTVDLGRTYPNFRHVVSFVFRNSGTAPVRVLRVPSSCGCATVEFPADPIPVGGEAAIKAKVNVGPGGLTKVSLRALFDVGGRQVQVPLQVEFHVFDIVSFEPQQLVLYDVRPGETIPSAFCVTLKGTPPENEGILASLRSSSSLITLIPRSDVTLDTARRLVTFDLRISDELKDTDGIRGVIRTQYRGQDIELPMMMTTKLLVDGR